MEVDDETQARGGEEVHKRRLVCKEIGSGGRKTGAGDCIQERDPRNMQDKHTPFTIILDSSDSCWCASWRWATFAWHTLCQDALRVRLHCRVGQGVDVGRR